MKPFTVGDALEAGIVTPGTMIQTGQGAMTMGRWTINDSHPNGLISVAQVIQKSSNIGSAKIQLQMPAETLGTLYRELGFGVAPQSGFPGEAKGQLKPWSQWRPIEQATMAYGHGLSVSLLQISRAYTVFTTGREPLPLSLLKQDAHPIGKRIITRETADQVTRMMDMAAMPGGTAPRPPVPAYPPARHTGTAHKAEAGGYAEHKYVSSFVGFAPVTNPRFIVAVMLDEPHVAKYFGGDVGGPEFSSVRGNALRLMGLPPDAPTGVMQETR